MKNKNKKIIIKCKCGNTVFYKILKIRTFADLSKGESFYDSSEDDDKDWIEGMFCAKCDRYHKEQS